MEEEEEERREGSERDGQTERGFESSSSNQLLCGVMKQLSDIFNFLFSPCLFSSRLSHHPSLSLLHLLLSGPLSLSFPNLSFTPTSQFAFHLRPAPPPPPYLYSSSYTFSPSTRPACPLPLLFLSFFLSPLSYSPLYLSVHSALLKWLGCLPPFLIAWAGSVGVALIGWFVSWSHVVMALMNLFFLVNLKYTNLIFFYSYCFPHSFLSIFKCFVLHVKVEFLHSGDSC